MSSWKSILADFILIAWLGLLLSPWSNFAIAEDHDTIVMIDGRVLEGEIRSIDEQGQIQLRDGSNAALTQVLSIQRNVEASRGSATSIVVHLAYGGTLLAQAAQLQTERVAIRTSFGELDLPIEAIRAIVFKPSSLTDPMKESIIHPSNQFDLVWAESNDGPQAAEGLIRSIAEGKLTGTFDGQDRTINQARIVAFVAADLGLKQASGLANCLLADGSQIRGSIEKLVDDQFALRFPGGGTATIPWSRVVNIGMESDRLVWLSDLSPISNEQEPIVTSPRPTQFDKSVDGNLLTLRSSRQPAPLVFSKGLGVHAYSRLVYPNAGFDRLTAIVGLDAETQGHGDCIFLVRGDGIELWSQRVRASDDPLPIDIDVSNVREISLIVEPGAELDLADHANWCNVRLLRTK